MNQTTSQRSAWSLATPMLLFSCFCLLVGGMLFGYDTGMFGGILANPVFVSQFGTYNDKTKSYKIGSLHTSLLSSLAFIGKFIGCLGAGPGIERFGHRAVFYSLSVISVIGVIVEITSAGSGAGTGRFAQFIVGRIIVYISVGLVEVDVTTYQSEIVPGSLRGLVVVSLQLFLNMGGIIASAVNKKYSTDTTAAGWKTITGIQFIFPVLIFCFTFFIPSSPRWLLSKGRGEEAVDSLRQLRPRENAVNGECENELETIRGTLENHVDKAPWLDLFRGNNLRRTLIVIVYYFFQQCTGQAFYSTYSTTFYKTNGYAAQAFTYPIIGACLGVVSILPTMYAIDKIGRRAILMISFFFQGLWMFLLAGLGELSNKSSSEKNMVVASFMLYAVFYNAGGASIPYLLGTEIPSFALREKTQALGAAWNVVWAFVTNFVIPYMIADLHFKVGWVFGSISLLGLVFTFFFLPETKGCSLEETDAIFSVPFNPFRKTKVPAADRGIQVTVAAKEKDLESF